MKRFFWYSVQGKFITLLLLFMTVSLVASWFTINYVSQNIMLEEKGQKLMSFAKFLDDDLGNRSYDSILKAHDASGASREEKIAILNGELSGITERIAEAYPGLGVGFYSLELEAILTYGPSAEFGKTVGVAIPPDHPGRTVMADNRPDVKVGSMVRGKIMNAMRPVVRNGAVIGYIWVNELATDIEKQFNDITNKILVIMFIIYVLSIVVAIILSRRTMRDVGNIVKGVRELRFDLTKTLDKADGELGEVVDSINIMAADIAKAAEERKALLVAEAANLAQRDFLARMSHEIRTPMNGVLGLTHMAQNAPSEEKRLEYLGKIHASASLLLNIINDILDYSKIEAGKMEIEKRPFYFQEIIDNIQDLIRPKIEEKKLQMLVSVDKSVPYMAIGDGLRLTQVLLNLLGNSVKFTLQGSITLALKARKLPSGLLRLDCSVKDTGIGMDAQQQAAIFKPFKQADTSTARKFGGTGLGLSISKVLVELMGGAFTVTSEPNKGSEFAFFVEMEQHQEAAEDEHVDGDAAVEQRYDGFTLLLVEDIEINQEIAKFVLSEMGFEIDIADNGENGVNAFLKKDYDLIFMDIFMPIMDGLEATKKIRQIEKERALADANNPHPPRVPIIAMTANAMQEDQKLSKEAGMDGHIAKPLDIDEIKAILYKTLIKSK